MVAATRHISGRREDGENGGHRRVGDISINDISGSISSSAPNSARNKTAISAQRSTVSGARGRFGVGRRQVVSSSGAQHRIWANAQQKKYLCGTPRVRGAGRWRFGWFMVVSLSFIAHHYAARCAPRRIWLRVIFMRGSFCCVARCCRAIARCYQAPPLRVLCLRMRTAYLIAP